MNIQSSLIGYQFFSDIWQSDRKPAIAIIYSVPTARTRNSLLAITDDDTKVSALEVAEVLKAQADVTVIPVLEEDIPTLTVNAYDVVFNLTEWTGADTPLSRQVIAYLEKEKICFTGCDLHNFDLSNYKVKQKQMYEEIGILTPPWQKFVTGDEPVRADFPYPAIAKLTEEHCSIGITQDSVVSDAGSATKRIKELIREFSQPVILEEFIEGDEYHVPFVQVRETVFPLVPAKIAFEPSSEYKPLVTFVARWDPSAPEFKYSKVAHEPLRPELLDTINTYCEKIFAKLGFCDYARVDLRIRGNNVYVLETNSNPGLSRDPEYELTVSLSDSGISFDDLVWHIVGSSLWRYRMVERRVDFSSFNAKTG